MKKIIVVLAVLLAQGLNAQIYIDSYRFAAGAAPGIITDNLIAWYDASNAASYPGSGSTWFDLTTNNRDLSVSGATYSATDGGIFDFDGSNDYMTGSLGGSTVNSFAYWFKSDLTFTTSNAQSLFFYFYTAANYGGLTLGGDLTGTIPNEQITAYTIKTSVAKFSAITSGSGVANTWYHVSGVWDGTKYQLYLNGQPATVTVTGTDNTQWANISGFEIGARLVNNSQLFNGKIGEIQYYSDQLTASEVLQNYNATKTRYGY